MIVEVFFTYASLVAVQAGVYLQGNTFSLFKSKRSTKPLRANEFGSGFIDGSGVPNSRFGTQDAYGYSQRLYSPQVSNGRVVRVQEGSDDHRLRSRVRANNPCIIYKDQFISEIAIPVSGVGRYDTQADLSGRFNGQINGNRILPNTPIAQIKHISPQACTTHTISLEYVNQGFPHNSVTNSGSFIPINYGQSDRTNAAHISHPGTLSYNAQNLPFIRSSPSGGLLRNNHANVVHSGVLPNNQASPISAINYPGALSYNAQRPQSGALPYNNAAPIATLPYNANNPYSGAFPNNNYIVPLVNTPQSGVFPNNYNSVSVSNVPQSSAFPNNYQSVPLPYVPQSGSFLNNNQAFPLAYTSQPGAFPNNNQAVPLVYTSPSGIYSNNNRAVPLAYTPQYGAFPNNNLAVPLAYTPQSGVYPNNNLGVPLAYTSQSVPLPNNNRVVSPASAYQSDSFPNNNPANSLAQAAVSGSLSQNNQGDAHVDPTASEASSYDAQPSVGQAQTADLFIDNNPVSSSNVAQASSLSNVRDSATEVINAERNSSTAVFNGAS